MTSDDFIDHQFRNSLMSKLTYHFIDSPRPYHRTDYQSAIQRMCDTLSEIPGLISIYQIGSISTVGISDIDLIAIFDDKVEEFANPISSLNQKDKYLFIHNIYGETISNYHRARGLSLFHNFKHLQGKILEVDECVLCAEDIEFLKTQIALEFLVKMYINMIVQRTYRVFKLRGVFLHINAIKYDLEFLGTDSGDLFDITSHLIDVRKNWFEHPISESELSNLLDTFFSALVEYLSTELSNRTFYLPPKYNYRTAPNMKLRISNELRCLHKGIILPGMLSKLHPKFINLQHRFNEFIFEVPFVTINTPNILDERFCLIEELKQHHIRCLPHFAVLTSSLLFQ